MPLCRPVLEQCHCADRGWGSDTLPGWDRTHDPLTAFPLVPSLGSEKYNDGCSGRG